jgi:tetrahydromethanopterin S-methyltransferase subunit A
MERVLIVGRLLSENRGIDTIVKFTLSNQELRHIIVCGKEVKGHQAGQALVSLHAYGINNDKSGEGIIIAAKGHYPHLKSSKEDLDLFRRQIVKIHNLVGVDDVNLVRKEIEKAESMICT